MIEIVDSQERLEHRINNGILLRRERSGELNRLIGIEFVSCNYETLELVLKHTVKASELNPIKTMHGGFICWLLDGSCGILANAYTGAGNPTTDMNVHFIRAAKEGDELIIKARILKPGRTLITCRSEIYCKDQLCATGDMTFYVLPNAVVNVD